MARVRVVRFEGEIMQGDVTSDPDPLLTGPEAAQLLGIAPATWRVLVSKGYAPKADEPLAESEAEDLDADPEPLRDQEVPQLVYEDHRSEHEQEDRQRLNQIGHVQTSIECNQISLAQAGVGCQVSGAMCRVSGVRCQGRHVSFPT